MSFQNLYCARAPRIATGGDGSRTAPTPRNNEGNGELLRRLKALLAHDRRTTARLLWHLGEVDARGLYRDAGYSAMFVYCVEALHMSEAEAGLRIRAARLARDYPVVLGMVERGELHLRV
jgi:hypothetical protein